MVKDANGAALGTLLSFGVGPTTPSGTTQIWLYTPQKYIVGLDMLGTLLNPTQIYYTGANCTGTPYLNSGSSTAVRYAYGKSAFWSPANGKLYAFATADANGRATTVNNLNLLSSEDPTTGCGAAPTNPTTKQVFALTEVSRSTVGLPTNIALPLQFP